MPSNENRRVAPRLVSIISQLHRTMRTRQPTNQTLLPSSQSAPCVCIGHSLSHLHSLPPSHRWHWASFYQEAHSTCALSQLLVSNTSGVSGTRFLASDSPFTAAFIERLWRWITYLFTACTAACSVRYIFG